jgi:hypothetical protein
MVAAMVVPASPAFAQPTNFFIISEVQGNTINDPATCGDTQDPIDITTCQPVAAIPAGLVCDIPVIFTIGEEEQEEQIGSGFQCRSVPEPTPSPGGGGGNGGGGGTASPLEITQDFEQESESGDIDQSFDISGGGDNGSQCANVTGDGNTGNLQNQSGSLQIASDIEEIEQEDIGSDLSVSGTSTVTCEQQVNQAAAAG